MQNLKTKGIIYNLIGSLAPMALAITSIPALINSYGNDGFAVISMLWVIMGYFAFLEFGLPRVISAKISLANNNSEVRTVISNGLMGCAMISIISVFSIILFATFIEKNIEIHNLIFKEIVIYVALSLPAILIIGVYRGIAEGKLNFFDSNLLKFFNAATIYSAPAICAIYGKEFKTAIISIVLGKTIIAFIFYYKYIKKDNMFDISLIKFSEISNYYKYGSWIALAAATGPLLIYGDRFILTKLVEMNQLGIYSIAMELVTKIWIFPLAITTVIFPILVKNQQHKKQWEVLKIAKLINFLGISVILLLYYLIGDLLIKNLLNNSNNVELLEIISILIIGIYINSFAHYSFTNLQASQKAKTTAFINLLQLPPYFLMVSVFAYYDSIVGAAYAWTLNLIVNYFLIEIFNYKKHLLKLEAMLLFLTPILITFILLFGKYLVEEDISNNLSILVLALCAIYSSVKLLKIIEK